MNEKISIIGAMNRHEPTTRDERAHHVAQMRANFGIEGIEPDEDDKRLQDAYIDGTATIEDLLEHAEKFAKKI
ncbi:hypothetical protein ACO0K7_19510 [Undibacterium sp. Ji67W]|uniref:antitoxin VbhA family protein n=1 Tax=Undibacterium sp. Ji67W TaxID=3413042 RepID=UPI003BF3824E